MIKVNLPKVRQSTSFDCGAAIFRSICKLFGKGTRTAKEFIKICKTTRNGTKPENIVSAAEKFGLSAILIHNLKIKNIKTFLDLGLPVICYIQAYSDNYLERDFGHCVAAIGYDEEYVYFEDPGLFKERGYLSFNKFSKRWKDVDKDGNFYDHLSIVISNPEKPTEIEVAKEIP